MVLYLVSIISGFNFFVLSLVLFFKDSPFKKRNRYLAFLFLIYAIFEAMNSFFTYAIQNDHSILKYYISFEVILLMCCGPILFFYTLSITKGKENLNLFSLVHLIPILPKIFIEIRFAMLTPNERIDSLVSNYQELDLSVALTNVWGFLLTIFYLIISLRKLIAFRMQLSSEKVSKYDRDTGWFSKYIMLNLVVLILALPVGIVLNDDNAYIIIVQVIMNIQFIYIFVNVLWSSHLFPAASKGTFWGQDKYATSSLSPNEINNYFKKAVNYLQEKKVYTDSELTISRLAEELEIPVHYLSQVINVKQESNFFDFFNQFRVEEAKRLLTSNEFNNYTIEAIAYDCGFGTKTSFNRAFKKYTGKTPSEYRKM